VLKNPYSFAKSSDRAATDIFRETRYRDRKIDRLVDWKN